MSWRTVLMPIPNDFRQFEPSGPKDILYDEFELIISLSSAELAMKAKTIQVSH